MQFCNFTIGCPLPLDVRGPHPVLSPLYAPAFSTSIQSKLVAVTDDVYHALPFENWKQKTSFCLWHEKRILGRKSTLASFYLPRWGDLSVHKELRMYSISIVCVESWWANVGL